VVTFTILVTLAWFNPGDADSNAFRISHLNDRPLSFKTDVQCMEHVDENHQVIRNFVNNFYRGKAVAVDIICEGHTSS
tara:strand:- start:260 stop:493 length:234 start_codon:yes stop_codon:yes gene_type:complete